MGEWPRWSRGGPAGRSSLRDTARRNRVALCPRAAPPRPPHPPPTCAPTALSCGPRKASGPWTPQPHRSGFLALCPFLPSAPRFRGVGDPPHQPPQAWERVLRAESLGSRGWLPAGAPRGGNCGRRAGLGPHRRGRCRPRALPLGWGRSPLLPSVPVAQRTKPLMGSQLPGCPVAGHVGGEGTWATDHEGHGPPVRAQGPPRPFQVPGQHPRGPIGAGHGTDASPRGVQSTLLAPGRSWNLGAGGQKEGAPGAG